MVEWEGTPDAPPPRRGEDALMGPSTNAALALLTTALSLFVCIPSYALGITRRLVPSYGPAHASALFGGRARGLGGALLAPPETSRPPPQSSWLKRIIAGTPINRLPNPLAWLQSMWTGPTSAHSEYHTDMESSYASEQEDNCRPLPIHHTLISPTTCSCGMDLDHSEHSGPSDTRGQQMALEQKKSEAPDFWETFQDNDPLFPPKDESGHRAMLATFAEHVLSRAKFLGYVGGTAGDRSYTIDTITEPHRSVLLKLISDTYTASPLRNNPESMSEAPSYSASDMARALFFHKGAFTPCEWYIICVDWFKDWTGFAISDALIKGVGDEEWESQWLLQNAKMRDEDDVEGLKRVQPKLRRQFRAFAYWEEGYEYAHFRG
ncbi:hypothetical protein TWF718_010632 [Orbilia javanica]|uniref:Uncharacterized protein n=1 Tax=Orbilia javanica TaxID=47235 RepID=A0AAN8MJX7_9PEZI